MYTKLSRSDSKGYYNVTNYPVFKLFKNVQLFQINTVLILQRTLKKIYHDLKKNSLLPVANVTRVYFRAAGSYSDLSWLEIVLTS